MCGDNNVLSSAGRMLASDETLPHWCHVQIDRLYKIYKFELFYQKTPAAG